MKSPLVLILLLFCCSAIAQLSNKQVLDLKSGRMPDDTSYVYWLPYEKGKSYLLIQGANSKMSHQQELSLDFKMKKGSKVCAARAGTVVDARGDSDKGGLKDANYSDGNYVIIRHDDGSTAYYWHLDKNGAYVKAGEHVKKGQLIGASGNTGYTAFPHLHFQVYDASGKEIMVRFLSKKGKVYPRPGNWYKCMQN
ncbi:MAG TPA: M23 family metallopeptidase [Chitinophagaceae bacterium]|nr:M23 family metallopeptidase [Chitinophagaceae bacterium]